MAKCRQCGCELPKIWSTDICLECSEKNMKKIFSKNPEVKEAYKEALDETFSDENVEKMTSSITRIMEALGNLKKEMNKKEES